MLNLFNATRSNLVKIMTTISLSIISLTHVAVAESLTILVETKSTEGQIRAAIYTNQESFDNGLAIAEIVRATSEGITELKFNNLGIGQYGLALFQDLNANEMLDRNLIGIPTEPYGFSQNPTILFSAPKFDEFQFEFNGKAKILNITLNGE